MAVGGKGVGVGGAVTLKLGVPTIVSYCAVEPLFLTQTPTSQVPVSLALGVQDHDELVM